jgi:hypothetical protein
MKLFVFGEDVLVDYTSGMVLIVARDFQHAIELATSEFGEKEVSSFGWMSPLAFYDVPNETNAGVREFVFGGG